VDATTALVLIYRQAYIALLQRISKRAQAGKSIVYDAAMARDVRQILDELDEVTAQWARTVVPRLYSDGVKLAAAAWIANNAKPPAIAKGFARVHRAAVEAIAANMTNQLRDATAYVGRRIEDNVRRATLEAAAQKFATGQKLKDMKADLIDTFIDEGLTAIRDGAGREWRLDTYAEMVTRTTTAEAANAGLINQLKGYGHDLVQLSEHRSPCEICAPYEGRVYSMTGKTEGYPRLDQVPGFDMGYMNFHPNCRHVCSAYLPEFDKDADGTKAMSNRPFVDERTEADKRAYARSQEQNKLRRERKRLEEKVATLPRGTPEYEKAREKLRETRAEQQRLGREERKWKEQAARENRAYYAARDAGKEAEWPGRQ